MAENIAPYVRGAFYYETDKMGIVHHSNYIRWFEEARLDYMKKTGLDYAEMETHDILMPVTGVSAKFLSPVRYGDTVEIFAHFTRFNGVRADFTYEVYNAGVLAATGESGHCFVDVHTMAPLSLRSSLPEFYQKALALAKGGEVDKNGKR